MNASTSMSIFLNSEDIESKAYIYEIIMESTVGGKTSSLKNK